MIQRFGTVSEVVYTFADCLRVLTPYVTRVGIEWEDGKSYDDWDAIAGNLYSTIVAGTVDYTVEGEGFKRLVPFGIVMPDYSRESFLFSPEKGRSTPFLTLIGNELPFDTAVFLELDPQGKPTGQELRTALRITEFRARLQSTEEQREIANVIVGEDWEEQRTSDVR